MHVDVFRLSKYKLIEEIDEFYWLDKNFKERLYIW